MRVRIRWRSALPREYVTDADWDAAGQAEVAIVDEGDPGFDLAVVDANATLIERGATGELDVLLGHPKLILVDEQATEFALIERGHADPMDEFCPADASPAVFAAHFRRLLFRLSAQLAGVDGLTGLMTRRGLTMAGDRVVPGAAPEEPVSIIMIDMDNFKQINDEHGHQAGDAVLTRMGALLRDTALGVEAIGRYGAEEFVLIVREDTQQTVALAEFLRSEIELTPLELPDGTSLTVTATLGTATSTGGLTTEELLAHAEAALYRGKTLGRNCVVQNEGTSDEPSRSSIDVEIQGYEDRIRVLTQRLSDDLARRSRRILARLREDVERDGLTGLYNRRYFDERLPRELENVVRHDRFLSVAMIDLDKFGAVNRTYGFPGGDRALILAAATFMESIRTVDWVARYGGEEFVVVMPDTTLEEAVGVAERVRQRLESGVTTAVDGREIRLTGSIGVVELDGKLCSVPPDVPGFIQRASDKVREAKTGGRNQVCR